MNTKKIQKSKLIFDLSEVLIRGLVGIEKELSPVLDLPEEEILKAFGGENLQAICRGGISEDEYLDNILKQHKWNISEHRIKSLIRENFHHEIDGSVELLKHLSKRYDVYLLSDHAREWIEYIKSIHSFWDCFNELFFSFDYGVTKKSPKIFELVLNKIGCKPEQCLFIDDSGKNIMIAESFRIKCIHFTSSENLRKKLLEDGMIRYEH